MDETKPPSATDPAAAPPAPPEPTPAEPAADAATPAGPAKPVKVKKEETWWDTLRFLLYLFLGAVLLRTFLFAPFSIPSGSMMPNLLVGDYLFVSKWSYGYSRYSFPFHPINFDGRLLGGVPERGDVVVFRHPTTGEDWVKRVVGLPGDTIEVRRGVVVLNGQAIPRERIEPFDLPVSPNSPCQPAESAQINLEQPDVVVRQENRPDGGHCLYPRFRETLPGGRSYEVLDQGDSPGDNFGPVTVPAGHLFMMGDNRDDSLDSRFTTERHGVGFLPVDNALGRATIGFWSTDGSASWIKPWTWFTAARWSRIGRTY
ncbi:MAG TPA: signal peptidase I [Allosphingosinicella sp.]|nr:signal peptidase I [Allosphingosinicella sp.]